VIAKPLLLLLFVLLFSLNRKQGETDEFIDLVGTILALK
jgi:hypothetical protein